MNQPVYKNRIETILEEKKELNDSEVHFFQEINGVKEENQYDLRGVVDERDL